MDAVRVARALWAAMEARRWDDAGELLHEDAVVDWPQSRERIEGRDQFLAINKGYPGDWSIEVHFAEPAGEGRAVTLVRVPIDGRIEWAMTLFHVEEGRVRRATELWGESYPAPEWRSRWVKLV